MMCARHMHIMRMAWPYGWSSVSMFSEWDVVESLETFTVRSGNMPFSHFWPAVVSSLLASVQFELLLPSFLARAHRPKGIDGPVTSEPGRSSSSAPAGSLRSVAALGRDMHVRCWGRRRWLVDAGLSDTSDERSQVLSITISQIYHSHPSALCAD